MEQSRKHHQGYQFPCNKLLTAGRTGLPLAVLVEAGSFSPITNMHLRVMEQCRDQLQHVEKRFEIVGGFITPVSDGYGKKGLEKSLHRVNMCMEGVADSDWLSVDTWESDRAEWTPTLQVLKHIESEVNNFYQNKVRVQVIIACGADLLQSFGTPGVWAPEDMKAIFSQFTVACLERDGVNLQRVIFEHDLMSEYRQNIVAVPQFVPNAISSTAIRLLLRRGLSTKYLIPDRVAQYIRQHGLYGDNSLEQKVGIFKL